MCELQVWVKTIEACQEVIEGICFGPDYDDVVYVYPQAVIQVYSFKTGQ